MLPAIPSRDAVVLMKPSRSSGHASWLNHSAHHDSTMGLPSDSSVSSHRELLWHRQVIDGGSASSIHILGTARYNAVAYNGYDSKLACPSPAALS